MMMWRALEGVAEDKSCQGSRRFCLLMREISWKAWLDFILGIPSLQSLTH